MNCRFKSYLAHDLTGFLSFKRARGYRYHRAEFTLRVFDQFLAARAKRECAHKFLHLHILEFLARGPVRGPISVGLEMGVLRQLYAYVQRSHPKYNIREPRWPRLPTQSQFVPIVLSRDDIRTLLVNARTLGRPAFRADLYRALILMLYCTGIRFGEALKIRIRDIDIRGGTLFIRESKGRARWVPFRRSLARELERYMAKRSRYAPSGPDALLFVGADRTRLPVNTASETVRGLLRKAGLKPEHGRVGARPYDLRHSFAVHRLTQWYRAGVNLHERLPWLSTYMGHQDILGTETYLTSTAELLGMARDRFRHLYLRKSRAA